MTQLEKPSTPRRIALTPRIPLTLACMVVILAGMREASFIVVPFLLALFISIIAAPMLAVLQARGVPTSLAFLIVFALVLVVGGFLAVLIAESIQDFSGKLNGYTVRLRGEVDKILAYFESYGLEIPREALFGQLDTRSGLLFMFRYIIAAMSGIVGHGFLILVMVFFILLEAAVFPRKIQAVSAGNEDFIKRLYGFVDNIRRYMLLKTVTSASTGVLIAIALYVIGVDYAVMWGTIAFLLNYVPNIGSLLAAIPAVSLAFLQLGTGPAIYTSIVYLAVNMTIGSFLEPRFMGHGLNLSALIVFLSLVFWGWALGPAGMLLSVPLTMAVKIILEANPETRWIAVIISGEIPRDYAVVRTAAPPPQDPPPAADTPPP